MSKKGSNQHIVPNANGGGWAVKPAGGDRASKIHPTKAEAVADGRSKAQNQSSELIIHNKNGQISQRNGYGNDSFPPKG